MAAHVNSAYYQHTAHPAGHMVATVNPAYFQAGYSHHVSSVAHAGRHHSSKGKAKKGTIQHRHQSPLPPFHDPFGHKGMGKVR